MSKILFFNSPSRQNVYVDTNVSVAAPSYPNLTLATLAGHLRDHEVRILDLELSTNPAESLLSCVAEFKPNLVGASIKTPDFPLVKTLMSLVKEKAPGVTTIVGGAHVSTLPEEVAQESCFDILVLGEGDRAIPDILRSGSLGDVPGIIYKKGTEICRTPARKLLEDLDALPYPDWSQFDLKRYGNSRLSSRKNPCGHIETSRGCAHQCNFCNKSIFGSLFRVKSVARVVDEMENLLSVGFKEIHIVDDSFTQNINRAKDICREILRRKLKFPWTCVNGVRVDMVDREFFQLAKKAGCWQIGFGIESGDQAVLDRIKKRTTLAQIETAVRLCSQAGISACGFFILGLAGETEDSMRKTIDFSKNLALDAAKFDVCIPYPGTEYFKELKEERRIRSEDWSKYLLHQIQEPLFDHPSLSWDVIGKYYKAAFREFYLRPGYILRRVWKGLANGDIFYDLYYFLNSKW